ncbi:MAG: acyl-CoA thioesterase II [Pseudomonadota bacterium]
MSEASQSATETAEQRAAHARELLSVLTLEPVERNLFLGRNETRSMPRLFGGQVLAQALRAALDTVEAERVPHSLHGYFLRPGNPARPVLYEVDRIRDGGSFTTRRVVAIQEGEAILNVDVSLQREEGGMEHAMPMPNVPPPDELEDDYVRARRLAADHPRLPPLALIPRAFEMRSAIVPWVETPRLFSPTWLRFVGALPADDPALPYCLLAYASDMGLMSTSSLPHVAELPRTALQMASLDHAIWFHRRPSVADWLLFAKRTTTAVGARGLSHAEFYDRGGELMASVSQEGLLRPRR